MIYFLRSATIAQGKLVPARQFASEIADYIETKTGTSVTVGMPIGGHANRIGWFVSYKSLAELDETQTKLLQDSEYLALTTKGADNFIAGSLHDEIWRIF
jgi:NIPSNAP